eukprot:TRINITY_DN6871_c0_g1_i2.p1 TRINITY_DN6871_c0_g1~~TRINITY_DN6871_c0_g1_i2.p1  ORF type:complete len:496 (+),score=220.68 TRINITY_DN6871_c0_g1_i2:60-1547(+)
MATEAKHEHCCDDPACHSGEEDSEPEVEAPKEPQVGDEEQITPDGGIVKKLVKKGERWRKPPTKCEVTVHYVGKLLDGTVFDSSRDRGQPFTFNLGKGEVIKGWDEGVAKMEKGEIALLTIKPEYAYGERGSPPKIGANATLQFEVELIGWTEAKDVSSEKDGSIMKKTITEGDGYEMPDDETLCTVTYKAFVKGTETPFESKENFQLHMGEEEVISGVEKALETMKKKEKAEITIMPVHAYGKEGCKEKNIPADATLVYDLELIDFDKPKSSYQMTAPEQLEYAEKKRLEGNQLYGQKKIARALKKYKRALNYVESDYRMSEEEKKKAKSLKLPCYLNIAACKVLTKEWPEVLENCKKALEIESTNVKALLRRGKAYSGTDDWELAERDFNSVLTQQPDNAEAKKELALLNKKIARQNARDKKTFAGLFQKLGKLEQEEERRLAEQKKQEDEEKAKKEKEEAEKKAHEEKKEEKKEEEKKEEPTPAEAKDKQAE